MKRLVFFILCSLLLIAALYFSNISLHFPKVDKALSSNIDNHHPLSISTDFGSKKLDNVAKSTVSLPAKDKKEKKEDKADADFKRISKPQRIAEAIEWERTITLDPALGYVPLERRIKAWEQSKRMQSVLSEKETDLRASLQKMRWIERGPGNVGGRTRAMLVDMNDPTKQTLFAGGATGGLFRIKDINGKNSRWERINDWLDVLTVSSIVQDPKNPKIIYVGTGDVDAGDSRGNGIFKSTDGGNTWKQIPSTSDGAFSVVSSMIITPEGDLFAATYSGIYKSKNGGDLWNKVLGSGLSFGNTDDKWYDLELASNGTIYAASPSKVFKATKESGGEVKTWQLISNSNTGFPTDLKRLEIAVAPSDPNVLYLVGCTANNAGTPIFLTRDGGSTWSQKTKPFWKDGCNVAATDADFTRGQAWYDLSLIVAPNDPNTVYVGGIDFFKSTNSGQNWVQMTLWSGSCGAIKYAHADQHGVIFEPNNPSVLYLATDGGVFKIDDPASDNFVVTEKTDGFITTQFYACAIHPTEGVNHLLAGAQDNGTLLVRSSGVGNANGRSIGGDGFLCFIDQNEPNIQIGSLYYGRFFLSTNNGESFNSGANSAGGFLTPADYDDNNNILYAQTTRGELWRWKVGKNTGELLEIGGITLSGVSNIYVDLNVNNRVYVGTTGGKVYRLDNAADGTTINNVALVGSFTGSISSISAETGDKEHLLVTISNYGVKSVYETANGGTGWVNVEGNLPDMPIRWGMINPNDNRQAILATDFGVWTTDFINGDKTIWNPPFANRGTPFVRTDMLQMRKSDNTIVAATYGRGLWTSTSFSTPKSIIDYSGVSYVTANTPFKGEGSNAADTFLWEFGDGGKDSVENTTYEYKKMGTYNVSLTVNGDPKYKTTSSIKILPKLPTPYKKTAKEWLGDFESSDEHFGAYSSSGSKFEKGKSVIIGKAGTNSGNNAYVLGLKEQTYQKNTTAYLYLPMYDMSVKSIYQFSFWAVYDIQKAYDGMQVEYSLDKGLSWQVLGSGDNANWYDYKNNTVSIGAFPVGTVYFSGILDDWKRFKVNISHLSGNPNVAFRFVFKSDSDNANGAGVAIDDVEISRYEGELKTVIAAQNGNFAKTGTSIDLAFKTQPEFNAKTFDLEISENGRTYKKIATVKAKGESTEDLIDYTYRHDGTPFDVYFFRIKSINEDASANYKYDFYSPPFVVKRFQGTPLSVNKVFPSPFSNFIGVLFNDVVNKDIEFDLYDVAGRLISHEKKNINGVYHELSTQNLAKGIYLLSVKIGEDKPVTYKIFGGN